MTPAQNAGLVVGQKYTFQDADGNDHELNGVAVTFRTDDGTHHPAFDVPRDYDSDGWAYLALADIQVVKPVAADASTFSVTVSETRTDITIGKPLTAAEVAKVLEAAGVK